MHLIPGFISCALLFVFSHGKISNFSEKSSHQNAKVCQDSTQEIFWNSLTTLCGKSFAGTIIAAPQNDTIFKGNPLIMHVCKCDKDKVFIPFIVGRDSSRTWVITKSKNGIELKHDHRHRDGSPDHITMYGGSTTNAGNSEIQFFPADSATRELIPAAAGNVWWVEIVPDRYYTYNLRRVNTDRLFSVKFDLSKTVHNPAATWGWK